MWAKWVGAAVAAGMVCWFGWGLAGAVGMGCEATPKGGCGVPDGGGKYFAAVMIAPVPLAVLFKTGLYRGDWRPALGYPAGAVAGAAVALRESTSVGHWIVALVLLSVGALVVWAVRFSTEGAREARRLERARRLREERRERARVRRTERRRERRGRRRNLGA
ncbi:hypothetical protein [Streptomyces sp. B3I8]|uniref:hypothetical protein n=1 Tax=Streptomyces sp. B3I8 TaxID=3042303 RepID=UPI0027867B08|nr:hypothetical protein [Streptomyces sp. B3I8]MDQ0788878.1 hypothetical protein [Streptomyces sp. B3I8]